MDTRSARHDGGEQSAGARPAPNGIRDRDIVLTNDSSVDRGGSPGRRRRQGLVVANTTLLLRLRLGGRGQEFVF